MVCEFVTDELVGSLCQKAMDSPGLAMSLKAVNILTFLIGKLEEC